MLLAKLGLFPSCGESHLEQGAAVNTATLNVRLRAPDPEAYRCGVVAIEFFSSNDFLNFD